MQQVYVNQGIKAELSFSKTNIIFLTVVFSFILDVVNNYLLTIQGSNYGIAQVGKTVIMLILITLLRNKQFLLGFCSLVFVFILREVIIMFMGQSLNFSLDLVDFSRFTLMFLYLGIFYQFKHTNLVMRVSKFYLFVCFIQAASIIMGYAMKINFLKAYEYRDGYKGIFFGINDVAFFMVLAYFHAFMLLIKKRKILYFCLIAVACFILGLGSRSTLISLILVPYLYWFFTFLKSKSAVRKFFYICVQVFIISFGYFYLKNHFNEILLKYFSQSLYLYQTSGDIFTAFFSMRNMFVGDYFSSLHNIFQFLFGLQLSSQREMIESDIFDFLMRLGFIGTVIYLTLLFRSSKTKIVSAKPAMHSLYVLIIVLGAFMGHVLLSSINAPWIAFILILYSTKYKEIFPKA